MKLDGKGVVKAVADQRPVYRVRTGSFDKDASAVLDLWKHGFDVQADAGLRKIKWMYQQNPAGQGVLHLVEDARGSTMGVFCLGQRSFACKRQALRGATMADFVIAREHRSLGPALLLLKGAVAAGNETFDFLYGFPNERAAPVFNRAEYKQVGTIRRYAKLLRTRQYLRKRVWRTMALVLAPLVDVALLAGDGVAYLGARRRYKWRLSDRFDLRFDALWAQRAEEYLISERSSAMLRWRMSPHTDYRVITATARDGGALVGYLVWRSEGTAAQVLDFFSSEPGSVTTQLLRLLNWEARRAGCTSVALEFCGPAAIERALVNAGLQPREGNPVYGIASADAGAAALSNAGITWYLTSYDRDG